MKREFETINSKFIFTKDEFGFQEVLSEMETAKQITIVTYNISEKQTDLLNCLRNASDTAEIKIITNIPKRWENYYGQNYRDIAQKKIAIYMTNLQPEDIGKNVSVFFNFNNHGKIIMTENVVYVGSSNFSEESKRNIEFGFIVRDPDFIQFLLSEIIPEVEKQSIPYFEYDFMSLLLEANMALSILFSLNNELYDQIYYLHDDIDGELFYYNNSEDSLSRDTLERIIQIILSELTNSHFLAPEISVS
jgi:phosphatidylserine/phosphatidylglycerophosphate/cardiolipin synthase-like enzyme